MNAMSQFEIEARSITKSFGSLVANNAVDLRVMRGEVHALMGENGAGKSTLMSILYGMQQPDAGTIVVRGRETKLHSPSIAMANGIGMVHQHFKLFEPLTVWENIVFGVEPRAAGLVNKKAAIEEVVELSERYGMRVDPKATVSHLSVGVRQRIEILKALYRGAETLILDEPTAVLGPRERDALFAVVRELTTDKRTIIIVTHKINEVLALSQNITVMRAGQVTSRIPTVDATADAIIEAMTGRIVQPVTRSTATLGDVAFSARNLRIDGQGNTPIVDDVSFDVKAGEIVGIAGVAGNGQVELIEGIVGLREIDGGEVRLSNADITSLAVGERRNLGLTYIPEDRAATGTAVDASAEDNLLMGFQRNKQFSQYSVLSRSQITKHARHLISKFGVKIENEKVKVGTLSGGNLQKIVVAREIAKEGVLLIAEQPTRGVDVGAIENIHAQLLAESAKGRAVLLVSSELSELLALCDRIIVMFEGRALAIVERSAATETNLGYLMAGKVVA